MQLVWHVLQMHCYKLHQPYLSNREKYQNSKSKALHTKPRETVVFVAHQKAATKAIQTIPPKAKESTASEERMFLPINSVYSPTCLVAIWKATPVISTNARNACPPERHQDYQWPINQNDGSK